MQPSIKNYDAIIIGSGIGGLTCASLLSILKKSKVLVLERHFKPGGFTHTFRRNARSTYEWDVGLHYVGELNPGSLTRSLFDFITRGRMDWHEMPDVYDIFVYPDITFKAHKGKENIIQDLVSLFPDEEPAIRKYFHDLNKTSAWFTRSIIASMLPESLKPLKVLLKTIGSRIPLSITKDYLASHFKNEKLKALLISQWGTYGLPPESSAFLMQALIANHYMNGGYYPVGGAKKIAETIIQGIELAGGRVALSHEVTEIIIKNNCAVGVRVTENKKSENKEHEFYAPLIISAAGAHTTYIRLLKGMYNDEIKRLGKGTAHVTLYAGLNKDPRELGLHGENYWIFSTYDHTQMFFDRNQLVHGLATHCFVSFPSLKNPLAQSHTMEVVAFLDDSEFAAWADQPWKKRGVAYDELKKKIATTLLQFVEKKLPGISEIIDYTELSTPLSTFHFTGHPGGAIYGIPVTPDRFRQEWLKIRTPLKNLLLTGSDVASHGISGAMFGGLLTSAVIMGFPTSLLQIYAAINRFNKKIAEGMNDNQE